VGVDLVGADSAAVFFVVGFDEVVFEVFAARLSLVEAGFLAVEAGGFVLDAAEPLAVFLEAAVWLLGF
jgi:hypothetical protein